MRQIADKILRSAERIMPKVDQDWAKAMRAETRHIDGMWERLNFAIGVLKTATLAHLRAARWEPIGRLILSVHIMAWVGAKFYGGVILANAAQDGRIELGAVQYSLVGLAGLAYLGICLCLAARKWIAAMAFGLIALVLNSVHLLSSIFAAGPMGGPVDNLNILSLALIAEDYFIWTTILIGGAGIWLWQTRVSKVNL